MSDVHEYDVSEMTANFSGFQLDSKGMTDDQFLNIEQNEDNFTFKPSVDGGGTWSKNKSKYCEVTLTVLQSSPVNPFLSAILNGDLKAAGGNGIGPLLIKDRQGNSLFACAGARILKFPAQGFAKEVGTREWRFGCPNPEIFVGGNVTVAG